MMKVLPVAALTASATCVMAASLKLGVMRCAGWGEASEAAIRTARAPIAKERKPVTGSTPKSASAGYWLLLSPPSASAGGGGGGGWSGAAGLPPLLGACDCVARLSASCATRAVFKVRSCCWPLRMSGTSASVELPLAIDYHEIGVDRVQLRTPRNAVSNGIHLRGLCAWSEDREAILRIIAGDDSG